jgi:hypothetical protein
VRRDDGRRRWRRGRQRCRSRGRYRKGRRRANRQGHQVARRARDGTPGRRRSRVGASSGLGIPARVFRAGLESDQPHVISGGLDSTIGNYLDGVPLLHAHRRAGLGAAGRHPRGGGEFRPVGLRVFYCEQSSYEPKDRANRPDLDLCSADGSSPWS